MATTEQLKKVNWSNFVGKDVQQAAQQILEQLQLDGNASMPATALVETVLATLDASRPNGDYVSPAMRQRQATVDQQALHQERAELVTNVVQAALREGLLQDDKPVVNLVDWDAYVARLHNLKEAFSEPVFNHALAIKANPIRGSLREAQRLGFGAECASFAEAKHALSLGFEPRKVVYDSPCKTLPELKEMMVDGVYINLDNEHEIQKVNEIFDQLTREGKGASREEVVAQHKEQIGLRINPVVGGGGIAATSTATASSKFGLPLCPETSEKLFQLYEKNPWLQGVHVHVGSQGCPVDLLVAGAKRAVVFANETNARLGRQQIQVLDIGGGMPTVYDGGKDEAHDFRSYAKALHDEVPELFSSGFSSIITEFGRSVFVKPGITVSKVEAYKNWAGQKIAVVHVGADQFPRTAYLPDQWSHCITVLGPNGEVKKDTPFENQDVAGPLCFSGDFLAKKIYVPRVEAGDWLVVHDTGGYTTAMYSKYNSRQVPDLYAYKRSSSEMYQFSVLKNRETPEETLAFWGLDRNVSF